MIKMRSLIVSIVALVAQLSVLALVASAQPEQPFISVMEDELLKSMEHIGSQLKDLEVPQKAKELKQEIASIQEHLNAIELPQQGPDHFFKAQYAEKGLKEKIPGIEEVCEDYGTKVTEFLVNHEYKFDSHSLYLAWKANKGNPAIVAKSPHFFEAVEIREACCLIKMFPYCSKLNDKATREEGPEELIRFDKNLAKLPLPKIMANVETLIRDYAEQWTKQRLMELVFGKDREFLFQQASRAVRAAKQSKEFKETCDKFSNQVKAMAVVADVDFDTLVYLMVRNRSISVLDDLAANAMKYVATREACLKMSQLLPDDDGVEDDDDDNDDHDDDKEEKEDSN